MTRTMAIGGGVTAAILALSAWGGLRLMKAVTPAPTSQLPVTAVKRGDVTITVNAKGELSGGHTEMLSAPMTGGETWPSPFCARRVKRCRRAMWW